MPNDLPAPNDPRFLERAAERIAELVTISKGGAFVLTTSLRSMRELHRLLSTRISTMRILLQGQAPKRALIGAFRASGDAVLVATMSFWEGVDVPGHALRLVVLEKAPFLVPTDPIVRARADAVQAEGRSAFMDYHVPAAGILLKQGFGRLIRTKTDAGVIALFDTRVRKRGYGQRLLAQLPPARRTERIEDVREFFATIASEAT
jgi:ATP-dependent DNA helicase DinG